ncbi:hypothetical protein GCM10017691_23840 [Pseudonocardia petroleophila]|uniref:Uncharacterized protein n=1 Tax=Pseudonocardia petroleophila TaxID=37331 RepID=A0A7G7MFV9_9PSEU|nr:hypothetical protein [Pseudonocardia petroleophila]QNG51670.1 hypothetical protein H6H00_26780 [Pseudonocardia petroleophila]
MIEFKSEDVSADEVEMADLFSIDGVVYQIPAKPKANLGLQLLTLRRDHGDEVGGLMLIEKMLGREAYDALANFEGLTNDMLKQVIEESQRLVLGSLEDAAGNSGSGSQKSAG